MERNKILMVEDDPEVALPLKEFFEDNGLEVFHTEDGAESLALFEVTSPALVLLDIVLPNKNGFDIIKDIRKKDLSVPIILMTGSEIDSESEIKGYELSAINYIKKPVLPQALLALVKNLLSLPKDLKKFEAGGYSIMLHNTYLEINGAKIKLRDKDEQILRKLLEKKGTLVERDEFLIEIWGDNEYTFHNRLDVGINRLRKKLTDFMNIRIRSLYGRGYLLEEIII
ncbi:MAG: response regulator transcription factor [Candidatus Azobacteroides sp.]|nr:response regulator transcription factor [Candidatus Azobacteroides sp.]